MFNITEVMLKFFVKISKALRLLVCAFACPERLTFCWSVVVVVGLVDVCRHDSATILIAADTVKYHHISGGTGHGYEKEG